MAVTLTVVGAGYEVEHVAVSGLVTLSGAAAHSVVEPEVNSTVPVGVPEPGEATATVAVYVTLWPTTGEAVALSTVLVEAGTTDSVVVALDVASLVSPP